MKSLRLQNLPTTRRNKSMKIKKKNRIILAIKFQNYVRTENVIADSVLDHNLKNMVFF